MRKTAINTALNPAQAAENRDLNQLNGLTYLAARKPKRPSATDILHLIWLMRKAGASIRCIAKCFGFSKSEMGRWVKVLDQLTEAEVSQLGQPEQNSAEVSEGENCDLSQLGHAANVADQRDEIIAEEAVTAN
jgi:hypothetical protein